MNVKSLLLDGITAKRERLNRRMQNILSQKFSLINDYPGGLLPFIEELEKEVNNIKQELISLNQLEEETKNEK